jgi:putative transposase
MRELGIRSVIQKKRLLYGRKASIVFANHLNREFSSGAVGQKLVTDITYVWIGHDFAYLSAVMDLYNNKIVAWSFSSHNDLELVFKTLEQLKPHPSVTKPLLYSNQGF